MAYEGEVGIFYVLPMFKKIGNWRVSRRFQILPMFKKTRKIMVKWEDFLLYPCSENVESEGTQFSRVIYTM